MKTISTAAILALVTATLGFSAAAPAFAQDAAAPAAGQLKSGHNDDRGFRPGGNGPREGLGHGDILGFERGAEAIEVAIVRLSHRLELTDAQQALLETLKTDALAAADTFSAATEGLRPVRPASGETTERPDAAARLENRIALETARLAALESVQPAFVAFFDSLSDEQKASFMPERGNRPDGQNRHQAGPRDGGFGPNVGGARNR